jgi:HEAT repeat protein
VDEALRAALGTLKGRLLAGAVQSVGMRRDAAATDALAALLAGADAEVAAAAARALGQIGSPAAEQALKQALGRVPAAADGLLACAERADGARAAALYDTLRGAAVPPHVKVAATRGAILSRGAAGAPLLLEQLRGDDGALFGVALRCGLEAGGAEVTRALAEALATLPEGRQVRVCAVLAERGDAAAAPALLALARGGAEASRVAAVQALARLGRPEAVPVLAELASAEAETVAAAALAALAGFAGAEADATIIALAAKPDARLRKVGVELIGRRRLPSAVPALLRAAEDAEPEIRRASLKIIGDLGGKADIPALLGLLLKGQETEAAADALAAVCARQAVPVAGSITIRKAVYGVLPDGPQKDVTAKVAALVKAGQILHRRLQQHLRRRGARAGEEILRGVHRQRRQPNARPCEREQELPLTLGAVEGLARGGRAAAGRLRAGVGARRSARCCGSSARSAATRRWPRARAAAADADPEFKESRAARALRLALGRRRCRTSRKSSRRRRAEVQGAGAARLHPPWPRRRARLPRPRLAALKQAYGWADARRGAPAGAGLAGRRADASTRWRWPRPSSATRRSRTRQPRRSWRSRSRWRRPRRSRRATR